MNDFETVDRLVNENIRLAWHYALRNKNVDEHEALSLAMKGLLLAAQQYSPERGKFHVFASISIEHLFRGHIRRSRALKRGSSVGHVPLDAESNEQPLAEIIADRRTWDPARAAIHAEDMALLNDAVPRLPKQWRYVLERRLLDGERFEQIRLDLGISEQRAGQILDQAKDALRRARRSRERTGVADLGPSARAATARRPSASKPGPRSRARLSTR
jgi:RNA polymerase sigma factor (sigma-70 family)